MATPHNSAEPGAFAKTVLMPGDPLRAKFIAETFLEDAKLVNNVRGVQGYSGTYRGVPVSVMASGMGMPSMGIYSYELFNFYGVENILRIGSAGAISKELKLRDVVAGMGACTNSHYAAQYGLGGTFAPIASFELLSAAVESARELGVNMPVGNLYSSDTFYDASASTMKWGEMGVLAVEMEAAALYCNAAHAHKRALAICSISDSLVTGEALDAEARQTTFTDMMKIALEVAYKMEK
ncbi:MAG: purine-nucleoside phosphorylase [Oscillospiraceae bacterium]|nr:purine-nucleoside phosphorylase [Oscillospiraceae bacterium]